MKNFNFEYKGNYLQYKDPHGNKMIITEGLINETASGPVVQFSDGADNIPVKSMMVAMNPIQDLHGQEYPWYAGGGKNLFKNPNAPYTNQGVTFTPNTDGSITISGAANTTAALYTAPLPFEIPVGTPVTISLNNESISSFVGARLVNLRTGSQQFGTTVICDEIEKTATVTETFTATQVNLFVRTNHPDIDNFTVKIQFEIGSDATEWTPYENICPISGREVVNIWREDSYDETAEPAVTVQLGDTIYGGTLDVVSGLLTVDMATVDLGTLDWGYSEEDSRFYYSGIDYKRPIRDSDIANAICSIYKVTKLDTLNNGTICLYTDGNIYVKDIRYSDAVSFRNAMDGVQLCYELAHPITVQLNPEQLTTLLGDNYIWTDADSVSVGYVADIKLYIQNVISDSI